MVDITITIKGKQGVGKSKLHCFLKPILKGYTNLTKTVIRVKEEQSC